MPAGGCISVLVAWRRETQLASVVAECIFGLRFSFPLCSDAVAEGVNIGDATVESIQFQANCHPRRRRLLPRSMTPNSFRPLSLPEMAD